MRRQLEEEEGRWSMVRGREGLVSDMAQGLPEVEAVEEGVNAP